MECGRTLYRRRYLLCSIAGLGVIAAAFASIIQTPIFRSQASVQIQSLNENFLNFRDIYPTTAPAADNALYIQTQAEILRQDALLEQVIHRLNLDLLPEFRGRFSVWKPFQARNSWTAMEELKKDVEIVPSRGSSIIQILCDARKPELAADLANTLAQIFIDQNIEARQRSARQTAASLDVEREALGRRLLESEARLDAYNAYNKRGREGSVYNSLKRELDNNRQFYQMISQRIDEARVASAMNQSNIRLVSPAQPAARPFRPNLPLNLVIGLVGGLLLGISYIMLREQTNSVWRVPGEASAWLAVPELGAIPKADHRRFPAFSFGQDFNGTPAEHALLDQHSPELFESFRAAVASILSVGNNGDHPHVLLVTSSRTGEGKTTVVSNLAVALTEIGGKVLLIDGDLRRPRLHEVFSQSNSWGLSDLLQEKNAIEEVPVEMLVKRTTIPRLHLLPAGTSADSIFSLLWSGRMARLVPQFRQVFDYVLIDAPPCLEYTDARILGRYADKAILVVRADRTNRQSAQAAVQRLLLDGIPILGLILNGWDPANSDVHPYSASRQELA